MSVMAESNLIYGYVVDTRRPVIRDRRQFPPSLGTWVMKPLNYTLK